MEQEAMTTASGGMEVAMPVGIPSVGSGSARGVPADPRARVATTERDRNVVRLPLALGRQLAGVVWADLAGAWVWRGAPPTVRDLWQARMPARERVPGENRALHWGWIGWNHAVLPVFAALATALWVLMHPARAGLAALVAAPLFAMWISR